MDDTQFGVLGHGAMRFLPVVTSTVGLEVLAIVQPKRKMQTHMIMTLWMVLISKLPIEFSGYRHS